MKINTFVAAQVQIFLVTRISGKKSIPFLGLITTIVHGVKT